MTRQCEKCGAEFRACPSSKRRFCSKTCGGLGRRQIQGAPWPEDVVVADDVRRRWYWRIRNAFSRCFNRADVNYPNYGGRGVTVCAEWVEDPVKFLRYGLSLPGADDPTLSLDRIDNDRGYEPGNLRMATRREQMRNRPYYKGGQDARECLGCGGRFVPGKRLRVYCERACWSRSYKRQHAEARARTCGECRKTFTPPAGKSKRQYCGRRCLKKNWGRPASE